MLLHVAVVPEVDINLHRILSHHEMLLRAFLEADLYGAS